MIQLLSLWLTSHSVVQALSFDKSFIPHWKRGLAKKWMKTLYMLLLLNGFQMEDFMELCYVITCFTYIEHVSVLFAWWRTFALSLEVAATNILVAYKSNALNCFRMTYGSPPQTINWQTLIHSGTLQKEL